jgi:hypothetical protein
MALADRDIQGSILLTPVVDLITGHEYQASETIKPGSLIERHLDSSVVKWRLNSSSTNIVEFAIALEKSYLGINNTGVDDSYAAGDAVAYAILQRGVEFWGTATSGETINKLTRCQSGGTGKLIAATAQTAAAGLALFTSESSLGTLASDKRCRFRVI